MTPGRPRPSALISALIIAALAIALGVALRQSPPDPPPVRPAGARPTLLLLTGLPLIFGDGFSLSEAGSPALTALQARFRVIPISVSSPEELARGRLLLMAQPRAQPAEDLVALDAWVRAGGRVLLLADPMLEWPSDRPLGDSLRPPPMFADTGLLGHWGLRLDLPDRRGPATRKLAGHEVATVSPGLLTGRCRLSADAFVADCRVGQGRAVVVADADFLNVAQIREEGRANLDALIAEIARLSDD